MSEENKNDGTPDAEVTEEVAANPLETLTSLVLDAADAANDSAQITQEAVSHLSQVVATNKETTKAVRNAPAIFGAIMLSVGIVMAVVVAMAFSRLDARRRHWVQQSHRRPRAPKSCRRRLRISLFCARNSKSSRESRKRQPSAP